MARVRVKNGTVQKRKEDGSMATETERKYLIKMPDTAELCAYRYSSIEQIYFKDDSDYDGCRVRRREYADRVSYTKTCKRRITNMTAVEDECEIGADDYAAYAKKIEAGSHPIRKTRYVVPYRGYDFEVDIYPHWSDRAIMEVELPSEDAEFDIPPMLCVIKEVTDDGRYKNHRMAYSVPNDEI